MPSLLYVVSEDWYFLSHRLPMAQAAQKAGFEVHVATRLNNSAEAITRHGFILHPVPFERGALSLPAILQTLVALRRIHKTTKPALVHHVALFPTMLGLLAMVGCPTASVNALTGMGYLFTAQSMKARFMRVLVTPLFRFLITRKNTIALVQNPDDKATLMNLGVSSDHIALIPGSGIDIEHYKPMPEPAEPITVGFVGRLLEDKGIRTLVTAHRILREKEIDVSLLIAGTPDPANPTSISQSEAEAWAEEPGITWLKHIEDVATVWARAHIAVLPSRREGLPKSLLEAAACGRPMIASDVPGCREVVVPDETGLLVPPDDPAALARAIDALRVAPHLRERYGKTARMLAVNRFSSDEIGRQTAALYKRLAKT